jgi:hypothetical protein
MLLNLTSEAVVGKPRRPQPSHIEVLKRRKDMQMTNHFAAADLTEQHSIRDLVIGDEIRPLSAHPADSEDDDLEVDDLDDAEEVEEDETDEDLLDDDDEDDDDDDDEEEEEDEDEDEDEDEIKDEEE